MPTTRSQILNMMLAYTLPDGTCIRDLDSIEARAMLMAYSQGDIRDTQRYANAALKVVGASIMDYMHYQMASMGVGDTISM
jgi:hypothetical protein